MNNMKSEKLQEAIMSMLVDRHYFFGEFSLFLNYKESNEIGTAGVTINPSTRRFEYYYNPEFIEKLEKSELRFLQIHECLHLLNNHIRRVELNGHDRKLSNIAQDMVINKYILDLGTNYKYSNLKMPEGGITLPKEYKGEVLYDDIYRWLLKEQEKLQNQQGQGQGEGQGGSGNSENENDGNSNSDIQNGIDNPGTSEEDKKQLQALKDMLTNDGEDFDDVFDKHFDVSNEVSQEDRNSALDEILTTLKHRDKVGADIEQIIEKLDIRKTKTNIFRKIKQSLERASIGTGKDKTYIRPNRRHPGVLKGFKRQSIQFNVILDTSGSMYGEFDKVLKYLLNAQGGFTLLQADTDVKDIKYIKKAGDLVHNFKLKGFGGTELMPAINKIKELKKENDALVILTDGYCDSLDLSGLKHVIIVSTSLEPKITNRPKKYEYFQTDKDN